MSADRVAALAEGMCARASSPCGECQGNAERLLNSPAMRNLLAEHEQAGREDNAAHEMCYVSGSRALEALLAEVWDEGHQRGLRDADLEHVADNPYREQP